MNKKHSFNSSEESDKPSYQNGKSSIINPKMAESDANFIMEYDEDGFEFEDSDQEKDQIQPENHPQNNKNRSSTVFNQDKQAPKSSFANIFHSNNNKNSNSNEDNGTSQLLLGSSFHRGRASIIKRVKKTQKIQ